MTAYPEAHSVPANRRVGNAGTAFLAWMVILACCGYVILEANWIPSEDERANEPVQLSLAAELTAKMVVGLADWSPEAREMILDQARALEQEGVPGQVARAVLAAELNGLDQAKQELATARAQTSEKEKNADRQAQLNGLVDILERLYASDSAATSQPTQPSGARIELSPEDRTMLETHLGWVGRLAPLVRPLADGSPDRESLIAPLRRIPLVMIAFIGWLCVCMLGGLAALITLLIMGLTNRLGHGFGAADISGAVYAEVFAVWTLLFVGGRFVAAQLQLSGLSATLAVTIGALLVALGWGLVRGVRWKQMRHDLGIHAGRGVVTESCAGVMTYCMAIPLLCVGLLMTIGLMALQQQITPDAPAPSHPVQQFVAGGDWMAIAQTMFLAAIVAPLVEETIFRGALYRHLRSGTSRCGLTVSFLLSAGVSSVLFAAIHPQGWPFIPVLASLALAFCVAREWRGSLLPGMVAHGMNNFVIMTLNVLLLAP